MPHRLTTFDGLTLPIYYKEGDSVVGTAEKKLDYIQLPGQRTWDALKGERARPFQMRYVMDCLLLGSSTSDLHTQEDALIAKDGVKGTLIRETYAGAQHSITARLDIPETQERIGGQLARPMRLVFDIDTPGWLGTNQNGSSRPEDTWTALDLTATNLGDYPYISPVLTLTAGAQVTAFTFLAGPDAAGRIWKWAWAGTLAADKALVINCGSRQITNDGAANYGLTLDATHNQNEWMIVPNGGLSFRVSATFSGTAPILTWTSYDVYR